MRLAIKAILESKFERLLALVGLVCSSFVVVNQGTARRDELNPMGDLEQITVRIANLLAARRGGLHALNKWVGGTGGLWLYMLTLTCFPEGVLSYFSSSQRLDQYGF